ncbi:MAG: MarR family transcriptional regulator [Lachnospiraceae bacterium]|nr:MarR family transcriptional regulator [Lachnospiraceae bacterium]
MRETRGGFLISQIKQIQGRVFDSLLQKAGIEEFNGAQGRILYVLWQEDNLPIIELSKKTGLAKTTLTSMLDRMEEREFLKRVPDSHDRRQLRIVLTAKAKALNDSYNEVSDEMSRIFYEGFSDEEIEGFEKHLDKILKNLTKQESK